MWSDTNRARAPIDDFPPRWASAWGDDRYGLWAELHVGDAVQRFRWIEPGAFRMHPQEPDERGFLDEQSGHRVTLSRGYWFADSRCSDALWIALTSTPPIGRQGGDDTSHETLEAEWHDVQTLLLQLHRVLPSGVRVRLPREDEWEFATLAGRNGEWPDSGTSPVHKDATTNDWGVRLDDMSGWEMCLPFPPNPSLVAADSEETWIARLPQPLHRSGAARHPNRGLKMSYHMSTIVSVYHGPRRFRLLIEAATPPSAEAPAGATRPA